MTGRGTADSTAQPYGQRGTGRRRPASGVAGLTGPAGLPGPPALPGPAALPGGPTSADPTQPIRPRPIRPRRRGTG
ncbi:hypothetical protein DMP17_42430 [Pseudonocardia sp. TMWB2A]